MARKGIPLPPKKLEIKTKWICHFSIPTSYFRYLVALDWLFFLNPEVVFVSFLSGEVILPLNTWISRGDKAYIFHDEPCHSLGSEPCGILKYISKQMGKYLQLQILHNGKANNLFYNKAIANTYIYACTLAIYQKDTYLILFQIAYILNNSYWNSQGFLHQCCVFERHK